MATSPKFPEPEPEIASSAPNASMASKPVTAAPRATSPVLLKYKSHTACWPATIPGPAFMVGWSSAFFPAEIVSNKLENVTPASVLARTWMFRKVESNEAAKRFPKLSKLHVGSPPSNGQPSDPVNREVQVTPPSVL